jgi:hypothetical protein
MVLSLVAIVLVTLASLLFGEEEHLGRILLSEAPRARGEQSAPAARRRPWRRGASEPVLERADPPAAPPASLGPASPAD